MQRQMQTIIKDITKTDCKYILQQSNCLTVRPHGLSATLENVFPGTCVYLDRSPVNGRSNLAVPMDRSVPGQVEIVHTDKAIVSMMAQFAPGKPGYYYKDIVAAAGFTDDAEQRLLWFRQCLEKLVVYFNEEVDVTEKIAVPYRIGCGLAGGSWKLYKKELIKFCRQIKQKVIVHKLSCQE
jgi:hypothetical protein